MVICTFWYLAFDIIRDKDPWLNLINGTDIKGVRGQSYGSLHSSNYWRRPIFSFMSTKPPSMANNSFWPIVKDTSFIIFTHAYACIKQFTTPSEYKIHKKASLYRKRPGMYIKRPYIWWGRWWRYIPTMSMHHQQLVGLIRLIIWIVSRVRSWWL